MEKIVFGLELRLETMWRQAALKTDEKTLILVDGEEDLFALPAIFLAPINSLVLYGQPNKGFVLVKVTDKTRLIAMKILKEMGFSEEYLKY